MHVVKAMIVFGIGNFVGTFINSIPFFESFPSKYVPVVNVICFMAMYIVNFFFTMRNYEHSMIVLERLLFPEDVKNLFYIFGFSTIAVNYLPKYLSLYNCPKTAKIE